MGDEAFRCHDGNRCPEVAGGEAVADGDHITTKERGGVRRVHSSFQSVFNIV